MNIGAPKLDSIPSYFKATEDAGLTTHETVSVTTFLPSVIYISIAPLISMSISGAAVGSNIILASDS